MTSKVSEALEQLQFSFEYSAEWRRMLAKEYDKPWDNSNARAAKCLEHLAATCADVSPKWIKAYERLWMSEEHLQERIEEENRMISFIGISYENAEDFIKSLCKRFEVSA